MWYFDPPLDSSLFNFWKKLFLKNNSSKIKFQNFKFFDPNTYKTTLFLLHVAPWIFGVEDITLWDPGLNFFVLLSRNMPDYGIIVWFAGTCVEKFSKFFAPLWSGFFFRKLLQNCQKSSDLYIVGGFKIFRICSFQNTRIFWIWAFLPQ